MRLSPAVIAACTAASLLAGCSSSTGHPSAAGSSTPTPGSVSQPVASTSVPGGSTTATTLLATGAVPAGSGASDMAREPKIAAGKATPPSVLTSRDLVVGTGPTAGPNATVKVQYVGALYGTGKVFDASWTDNGPTTFPLSEVVPGFREAIIGMRVGGRREVVIPPALGYGAAGSPPVIPPNATLVFVIDLLGIS